MHHHIFESVDSYSIVILIKNTSFNKQEILKNYLDPLVQLGVPKQEFIAFTVSYNTEGKAPVKFIKEYLDALLPVLQELKIKYLYIADAPYFKVLAGVSKAEPHYGYALPCKIKGYEHMFVILGLNYQTLIYNPSLQSKLDTSLVALATSYTGSYQAPGTGIIHSAAYPSTYLEIKAALEGLYNYPELTCDIETFSLKFNEAGIGTIAFAWDQHNGLAFACDYSQENQTSNVEVRALLLEFFSKYQGKLTWHNATFDIKVIIYTLWMKDLLDTEGLLSGLEIMTRAFDDTKIIAYLATNSTAGNVLGLKSLAHDFAGNWAKEDIKDIRRIPLPELLQYNLVDCLSTWYVKSKFTPIMRADNQEELYEGLFKDSLKTIIQMELTGMSMDAERIQEVKAELQTIQDNHLLLIHSNPVIKLLELDLQTLAMQKANAKLKTKQHPLSKFKDLVFNPDSPLQLQNLLYEQMGLPILDTTDTGQPSTGAEILEKLTHHTNDPTNKELLNALIGYSKVSIILTTFIPSFEKAILKEDGMVWLHGNFNMGGTVSARMSSSKPNMQNLPANSTYGKLIKYCFVAPPSWVFAGADFSSLEDRINTLLTKDPNKMKVYTDGYDSHSLRAFTYFRDECVGIIDTVASINSIQTKYPKLRQASKAPTFALTFAGTASTLVKNCGFSVTEAKRIESSYHELYVISDQWVQTQIEQAHKVGYSLGAFGLRIRAPLLNQVIYGAARIPHMAAAEARTLGNAISGQSYGLLNNRAANEFMHKVRDSKYRLDIKLVSLIHDSIYILIKDDAVIVEWANNELIKSMQWQELPELMHPSIKLGAELDVYYDGWHQPVTLPNNATALEILAIAKESKESYDT